MKCKNFFKTSDPKIYPAPLGDITNPVYPSYGSLHIKSHNGPSCGISWNLSNPSTWSTDSINGDRPPWTANILLSITAAMGK